MNEQEEFGPLDWVFAPVETSSKTALRQISFPHIGETVTEQAVLPLQRRSAVVDPETRENFMFNMRFEYD